MSARIVIDNEKGVVIVEGLPDFSSIYGCKVSGDDFTHIGEVFTRITACGRALTDVLISGSATITCPDCVAEIKYRNEHPEVASRSLGVVTHKKG